MTVIAWDGVMLAADRMASDTYVKSTSVQKIFRIRDHLVGASGVCAVVADMIHWFEQGAHPDDFPKAQRRDSAEPHCTMLVITPAGEVHSYQCSPRPTVYLDKQFAIGCGREAALAVMLLGHDAIKAVEISSIVSAGCGNGIDSLELSPCNSMT